MIMKLVYAGVIIVVIAVIIVCWLNHQMDKEYNLVLEKLNNISDIKVLKSGTFDEEFTVTNIFATVQIKNGGILTFQGLQPRSFEQADSLDVSRVGDWGIHHESYSPDIQSKNAPRSAHMGIDLLSRKPIANIIPKYNIKNVSEAIAHYKEILDFVENLPDFQNKIFEEGNIEFFCEKFDFKNCPKSIFFKWTTWKFKTNCLGTATGWCERERMACIKEWGDNYSWCDVN